MISISVPGSKSITNRALVLASMSRGTSVLRGALLSEDTRVMIRALRRLGISVRVSKSAITVHGGALSPWNGTLGCENSGTSMRFLAAILAAQPFESRLDGSPRMRQRPIKELAAALKALGCEVSTTHGAPPLAVRGPMRGGACAVRGDVSSQFISALLLAAPLAQKSVAIRVRGRLLSTPYINLTVEIMRRFGVKVKRTGARIFRVTAGERYRARRMAVEGDASSATYFWGISYLTKLAISVVNVPSKTLQPDIAVKTLLKRKLPRKIDCRDFPDGAVTLAALCAVSKGSFTLTGLSTLRAKECDRLKALAAELRKIGAHVIEKKDGLAIIGAEHPRGAAIRTYNDHRIAMCFGMLSTVVPGVRIENPRCVRKTYPSFWRDLNGIKKVLHQRNIVLSGMRGSGKSTVGRELARRLKKKFIDIDMLVEKKIGMPLARFVSMRGWKTFRSLEAATVRELATATNSVIATGGGTLLKSASRRSLKKNGIVVFLDCPLNLLKKRVARGSNRPSLTGRHYVSELQSVLAKRRKLYVSSADIIIKAGDTARRTAARLINELCMT